MPRPPRKSWRAAAWATGATCSRREMILLFRHCRLFTVRRIEDFATGLSRLPFGPFKAFVDKALHEEFGMETGGGLANGHAALLDAFMVTAIPVAGSETGSGSWPERP